MKYKALIVGAGFAGSVLAERIASYTNEKVLIVEKRSHIGGNAYDFVNAEGIMVQKYGPHIFHTNSKRVWDYLSKFTNWNDYIHRVIANVGGKEVYLPINLETMEKLLNRKFTRPELEEYFNNKKVNLKKIKNSRDVIISQIGEELYELFFKNYTKKQWGVYPDRLSPEVAKRLPIRFNRDTRYFDDVYQGIPKDGFTRMFERMLSNENIEIKLKTDYKEIVSDVKYEKLFYTGPIDYFFDYKHGKLPYRSLVFRFRTLAREKFQNAAVVNYPNKYRFTRITEFKHLYLQKSPKTTICYEYPKSDGDPYYPMPMSECQQIYQKYKKEADKLKNVYFVGRLAEYKYLNMDKVVENSLSLFEKIKDEL